MNKSKALLLVAVFFTSFLISNESLSGVYICTGNSSKRYHYSKSCRGLSNCRASIKFVDVNIAREFGRTLCGWED